MTNCTKNLLNEPEIALVCVNYKGADRVRNLLESVPSTANFGPNSVVIYDDGFPQQIVMPDNRDWQFRHFSGDYNLGVVGAYRQACNYIMDFGIDWCVLADDDLVFSPSWWESFRNMITSLPTEGVGPISWKSSNRPPEIPGFLEADTRLAGYCIAFTKNCYKTVGGFDTDFHHYHGDSDFCVRSTKLGMRSYRAHYPLVNHTEHASVTENPELAADFWRGKDTRLFVTKWGNSVLYNGYPTGDDLVYNVVDKRWEAKRKP